MQGRQIRRQLFGKTVLITPLVNDPASFLKVCSNIGLLQ